MARNKTLPKRHTTGLDGVYFKEIISEKNKVVDKIFFICHIDPHLFVLF